MHFKMFQKLMIFLIFFSGMRVSSYICGEIRKYNPSTHECVNNTIFPKQVTLTCGDQTFLEKYDTRTHVCLCKQIVDRSTMSHGLEKELRRRKCCGDQTYDPRFQTCCHGDGYKFKIHDHKPEREHVCCNLKAYMRSSSEAVCHRSAHNDKFFKPKKNIRANQKVCKEHTIVYRVDVIGQVRNMDRRYMKASVSEWIWTSRRSKRMLRKDARNERVMRIRLDEYSPQKDVTGKRFLIFSNHQYLQKKVFRLRFSETVYRLPNTRRLENLLTCIRIICKRYPVVDLNYLITEKSSRIND